MGFELFTYEETILLRNSTHGLRKNQLTRSAKKDQLASLKCVGAEAELILAQLYPEGC